MRDGVWIVIQEAEPGNPVLGVFGTEGEASQHMDAVISEWPDGAVSYGHYVLGWNGNGSHYAAARKRRRHPLGVMHAKAIQRDVAYYSEQERMLIEQSNELQDILDRKAAARRRKRFPLLRRLGAMTGRDQGGDPPGQAPGCAPIAPTARRRSETLDEAARELLTDNADGTYSIRIPTEGDRIITVCDRSNARIIAMAEVLRMKLAVG